MENLVSVKMLSYSKDYKHVLLTACSKPYGNNVTMKGLESIIKSGHLSVLEHCYASFDVTCSCRVLGQITRHNLAYLLPQGTMTNMVVTGNFRAWYEYLPKRLCKRAMPEHRKVAEAIQESLAIYVPEVFDRNFLNCENCTEKGCDF